MLMTTVGVLMMTVGVIVNSYGNEVCTRAAAWAMYLGSILTAAGAVVALAS